MVRKHLKLDDKVRVSRYAASAPPSKIGIKRGEVYTVKDLLYGLLLNSGNDAARALAERVSGSESAFAQQLTQQVRQWGAYRTRAATANGLPADDQYSTAEDLALMFRRAMQDPELAKIMETKYYTIEGKKRLRNHNRFLFTTPLAVAGKTGYTRAARHTYVGMFKNGDHEIIVAAMGSTKKKEWADLRSLVEMGFKLEGAPIAQLPPAEEKLRFARYRHHRKVHRISRRSSRRRRARVVLSSTASVPAKKRAALKRKPGTQKD
jgi:D-alanyl-D-alanine carboxypeptidase (penicillin-binding protein 5/6)